MAAGVTEHLWEMSGIVALWAAVEPKAAPELAASHFHVRGERFNFAKNSAKVALVRTEPHVWREPENCNKGPFSAQFRARSQWCISESPTWGRP
jgi:hypothetical protein